MKTNKQKNKGIMTMERALRILQDKEPVPKGWSMVDYRTPEQVLLQRHMNKQRL